MRNAHGFQTAAELRAVELGACCRLRQAFRRAPAALFDADRPLLTAPAAAQRVYLRIGISSDKYCCRLAVLAHGQASADS